MRTMAEFKKKTKFPQFIPPLPAVVLVSVYGNNSHHNSDRFFND